ncbi:MAG: FAD-dependent oxidoreductase [Cytophagales bacterium]|nr:FAD-dependent oxidoreductase [Cytophagales bacterium]
MKKKDNHNSRRAFLKHAAFGAGAATSFGAMTSACAVNQTVTGVIPELDETDVPNTDTDVIVVGAGVSGTYAAARLALIDRSKPQVSYQARQGTPTVTPQPPRSGGVIDQYLIEQNKTKLNVKLYEYSGRVGGRLLSTPIEGVDGTNVGPLKYAEFGGFRFDRQMKIVWETAQALGLSDEPFYYEDINIEQNNLVYVRGDRYPNKSKEGDQNTNIYNSYPNLSATELDLLKSELDLGTYITNKALGDYLPQAIIGDPRPYPDIVKSIDNPSKPSPYPKVNVSLQYQNAPEVIVTIPGTPNGFSLAFAVYHYAFNNGFWNIVQEISDLYEAAKLKAIIAGRPFTDWSWWNLKRHFLTQEAVDLLEDTGGYNEQGSSGSIETDVDESFYFSPKSGPLTYYTQTDPFSPKTAWRHITEGYSAIPQQLFGKYSKISKDKSIDVVKKQLIAFTKQNSGPKYKCLFYKRQQGPDASLSGSEALFQYEQSLITVTYLKDLQRPGPLSDDDSKKLADAQAVLANYEIAYCNFLVLSLPKRSLELINQNNFFFASMGVQKLLNQSVNNILAMRMFIAYPNPWWLQSPYYKALLVPQDPMAPNTTPYENNAPLTQAQYYPVGRARTDLGIRQLYYWCYNKLTSPNNPPDSKIKGNYVDTTKPAVLLASYNNGDATRYWRALQSGQPYDLYSGSQTTQAHLYNQAAGGPGDNLNIRNPQAGGPRHGSQTMGIEAHRQLVELHGLAGNSDIPLPYYVHFEDWSKDPWGGGWHSWRSGYSKEEYIPKIRRPLKDENIYIIGECYSNVQGWVQGALNAAEAMLQCELGLPWASWLSVDGIWLGQGTRWVETSDQDPDPNPCLNGVPLAPVKKK